MNRIVISNKSILFFCVKYKIESNGPSSKCRFPPTTIRDFLLILNYLLNLYGVMDLFFFKLLFLFQSIICFSISHSTFSLQKFKILL